MTPEQKAILNAEVANDPTGKGYAEMLPNRPGHVVDALNAQTEMMYKTRMITKRTILELPEAMARSILTKFKAFATQDVVVEAAVDFLGYPDGIDGGHARSHAMLDTLGAIPAPNGFTEEEVTALKNLSLQQASRAEVLKLPYMTIDLFLSRNQ